MNRGVMYIAWGDEYTGIDQIIRSVNSVKSLGLPVCLLTDKETNVNCETFAKVIRINFPEPLVGQSRKSLMCDYSPFDETLFLDTDTVVLGPVDFGFEKALKHGLAICHAPTFQLTRNNKEVKKDVICYNTGVIFFHKKNYAVQSLMTGWQELAGKYRCPNDQPAFCAEVDNQRFNPFVLPHTWNFRGHFGIQWIYGKIIIWHTRIPLPSNIYEWNSGHCNFHNFGKIKSVKGSKVIEGWHK